MAKHKFEDPELSRFALSIEQCIRDSSCKQILLGFIAAKRPDLIEIFDQYETAQPQERRVLDEVHQPFIDYLKENSKQYTISELINKLPGM